MRVKALASGLQILVEHLCGAKLRNLMRAHPASPRDLLDGRIGQLGLQEIDQLDAVAQGIQMPLHLRHGRAGLADLTRALLQRVLESDQGRGRLGGQRATLGREGRQTL